MCILLAPRYWPAFHTVFSGQCRSQHCDSWWQWYVPWDGHYCHGNSGHCPRSSLKRERITAKAVSTRRHIRIRYHRLDNQAIADLKYDRTSTHVAIDPAANIYVLWNVSLLFSDSRPAWSGMMQNVHLGDHPPTSSVIFLPMIDMSSSDPTCIYSTLIYVAEHAERHDLTPVITFD